MANYLDTREAAVALIREFHAKDGSKPWVLAKIFNNGQEKWLVVYERSADPYSSPYIEILDDQSAQIDGLL